jgi:hypothetical protein
MTSTLKPNRPALAAAPAWSAGEIPEASDLRAPLGFSFALVVVAGIASAIGAFVPSIFRDAPVTVGNARGTAVVLLVVGLPLLVGSMRLATRGSRRALIVWLGVLGYVAYNAVIFSFATVFNALFLFYAAMLSLSVWSIVTLAKRIDPRVLALCFTSRLPARAIGAFLVFIAIAFAGLWLADILPAIVANESPASLRGTRFITNPIEILDLAFTLPLCAVGGIWLWRRRPLGYVVAGTMLVALTIESAGIAVDQWFGHRYDPTQPLGTVPMFIVLTVVTLVPTIAYLSKLRTTDE